MAVINHATTRTEGLGEKARVVEWAALSTPDTGQPFEFPTANDRSVQVSGTFGGATCTIQGSNNGTDWVTLTDDAGVALTFTAAGLKQVLQVSKFIRPSITAGAGVAINVHLLSVRN